MMSTTCATSRASLLSLTKEEERSPTQEHNLKVERLTPDISKQNLTAEGAVSAPVFSTTTFSPIIITEDFTVATETTGYSLETGAGIILEYNNINIDEAIR